MPYRRLFFFVALALVAITTTSDVRATDGPLTRAHAHNDYLHERPLLDALNNGFCSVEADIFLVDGELLVAHTKRELSPERTLKTLYLDPLQKRIKYNGGRVHKGGPELTLLIDIKNNGEETWTVLNRVLAGYPEIFSARWRMTSFTRDRSMLS